MFVDIHLFNALNVKNDDDMNSVTLGLMLKYKHRVAVSISNSYKSTFPT